jgi:glycerol uptake facilitator-like aquaporin
MTLYSSSTGGALAPSIAVGFALAAGVLIGGPLTGGGVNPARALGPMIVSGHLSR